jgi:hypothetical protein
MLMLLMELAAQASPTIPQPPVDDVMPKTAETVFNVFIFLPLAIGLGFAIREIRKGRGPLLLFCILGGAFAATMEPIVDVLGQVYLKENNALGTFTVLDRTMPLYICFVYPWYVGGLGYLAFRMFERGVTTKALFQLWALDFVVDIALESPGILAGTYGYYGRQPFDIWGFPLWWGFVNPVMPMVAGALIYAVRPHLKGNGWKLAAVVPLIPMADGLANGATAWPMWVVLNQHDVPWAVSYLAGFVTLALALYAVWLISLFVAKPATGEEGTIFHQLRTLISPAGKSVPPVETAETPEATEQPRELTTTR